MQDSYWGSEVSACKIKTYKEKNNYWRPYKLLMYIFIHNPLQANVFVMKKNVHVRTHTHPYINIYT